MQKKRFIALFLSVFLCINTFCPSCTFAEEITGTDIGVISDDTDLDVSGIEEPVINEEINKTVEDNIKTEENKENRISEETEDIDETDIVEIPSDESHVEESDISFSTIENTSEEDRKESVLDESISEELKDESTSEMLIDESEEEREEETVGLILKTSIQDTSIQIKDAEYTGKNVIPSLVITFVQDGQTITLKENEDYTCVYSNNREVGTAKVVISGIGWYKDSVTKTFKITYPLSKVSISYQPQVINLGKGYKQSPVLKRGNTLLKKDKDYTVSYSTKKKYDKYYLVTMTVKGKNGYTGSIKRTYLFLNNAVVIKNNQAYKILLSSDINKCIGIGSLSNENIGIKVKEDNTSAESRKFIFKNCGSNQWKIISQANDYLIRGKYNSSASEQVIVAKMEQNNSSDKFKMQYNQDGTFTFISSKSGNALDVVGNSTQVETRLHYYMPNNTNAQKFYLIPVDATAHTYSGLYKFESINSKYALSVYKGNIKNYANINISSYINSNHQKFYLLYSGNGTYRIQAAHSGMVLQPKNLTDFGNVQQKAYTGNSLQKWNVLKNSSNTYSFLNDDYALDIYAGSFAENTNVDIYPYNGTDAQNWKLSKTSLSRLITPTPKPTATPKPTPKPTAKPTAKPTTQNISQERRELVEYAKSWVGKISYYLGASGELRNGGRSDCSWFVFHVFNHYGLLNNWYKSTSYAKNVIPNTKIVTGGMKNALPGDVLMWDEGGGAGHVIIYAGDGMAVGCNGITTTTGGVDYREYTYPCGRDPDVILRFTELD